MQGVQLLLVIIGAIGVTALVHRTRMQAGLVIVALASAVSFIPAMPRLELEPEIILSVVLPPLLYAAALEFSFFSFMRNIRIIFGLGAALVAVSAALTTPVAAWLLPGLGAAGAFVLAAILAPPDTVTIVTHGDAIGLPRRVKAVLTGESLVNDAAMLTLYSVAVAAVVGTPPFISNMFVYFLYSALVGVLIGRLLGSLAALIRMRLQNDTLEVALNLLAPFSAYLAAEQVHASGVLSVVMAGFSVSIFSLFASQATGTPTAYLTRLRERAVWPVINSLLEAFVFAYIGLQARFVLDDLRESGKSLTTVLAASLVLLLTITLIRFGGVLAFAASGRVIVRLRRLPPLQAEHGVDPSRAVTAAHGHHRILSLSRSPGDAPLLDWKENILVAWIGMRGIVSLAAAAGLPLLTSSGAPFPERTTIQAVVYLVVIASLLVQGVTIPGLVRLLGIDRAAEVARVEGTLMHASDIARAAFPAPGESRPTTETAMQGFEQQRVAIMQAVMAGEIDDEAAQEIIYRLDLMQAAIQEVATLPGLR